MKYSVGFLIGRFQPFHFGHVYLFEEALKQCEKIIVGIGSTNVHDEANPFSYEVRREMVEEFIHSKNLADRVIQIIPIPDIPDDNKWLELCLKAAPQFDVVVGDNDWVNGIFEKAGYNVLRVAHYKRELYEGNKIRNLRQENKQWSDRVPEYIREIIDR